MQAVILAAGLGTRMGQLTKDTPKPLLKIADKTLLEHNLLALPDEIDEVVLVVGYLKEQIMGFIGPKFAGKKITYVEQKELRGTGHALSAGKEVLHDRFLVIMGDDLYYGKDLTELIRYPLSVLVWEMKNDDLKDDRQAIVKINENGEVLDIIERQPAPKETLVNTGAYVLDSNFFTLPLRPGGNRTMEFGLPQTFLQMIRDGAKMSIVKATFWHKVASPEDLRVPNKEL